MTTIKAIVKDRRLTLDVPADWPDGMEVEIHPAAQGQNGPMRPLTPDDPIPDLEECLAALKALGPTEYEPGEREEIERQLKEMDRLSLEAMNRLAGSKP
ncbi:MAG: hypothetical protein U0793_07100 [Gemmataceae bacterium]